MSQIKPKTAKTFDILHQSTYVSHPHLIFHRPTLGMLIGIRVNKTLLKFLVEAGAGELGQVKI